MITPSQLVLKSLSERELFFIGFTLAAQHDLAPTNKADTKQYMISLGRDVIIEGGGTLHEMQTLVTHIRSMLTMLDSLDR